MSLTRFFSRLAAGILPLVLLFLAACGGGGGGGGGGGAGGGGSTPVTYSGNSNAAVVTATNASALVTNVFGSSDTAVIIGGLAIEGGNAAIRRNIGARDIARRLNRNVNDIVSRAARAERVELAAVINQSDPCDGGIGTVQTSGTLNDSTGRGLLDVNYVGCLIDGVTVNGPASLLVEAAIVSPPNFFPTDFTLSFTRLTFRGSGVSVDTSGSLRTQILINTHTEIITESLISLDNNTGKTAKTEDLAFTNAYDNIFSPSSFNGSIKGKIFDSVNGFVDIATIVPFFFSNLSQPFPQAGQMTLTGAAAGAGKRGVLVTALSSTRVKLELDLDGNGAHEITALLKWTDLSGPVGADLGDTDGDGMHNGWETFYGLLPAVNDAALDKDGDGASNLSEYLAGTDPNNSISIPAAVRLSISMSVDFAAIFGSNLTYFIDVSNFGATAATDVVVIDALPAVVNLVSVTSSQGSCSGARLITCNLGTLNVFGRATVTVVATPTAEGVVSSTAVVTTSSFDPETSDNSVTAITTVGQSTAVIQALIDNAPPNTPTVFAGRGTYIGGLNFRGRNIALQSSDGPARTTIILLGGGPEDGVRIGPGGAIKGFTIAGSRLLLGAHIVVSGQGTLIAGNIIDGSSQIAASAMAISGNNASPGIEGNIFRKISCDNVGVVAFVNNSSPLIQNNIFENNSCTGVFLTLPAGNTPVIMNNTFVGNRAGIRVDRRVSQATQIYRNNVIVQNGIGLEVEFGTEADNPVWQNNLVFGNTTDYVGIASPTGINGNISANPMFVNSAASNYRLQAGSPAINTGSSVGAPSVDFDGAPRPRPIGGNWDIGAFEAQ